MGIVKRRKRVAMMEKQLNLLVKNHNLPNIGSEKVYKVGFLCGLIITMHT